MQQPRSVEPTLPGPACSATGLAGPMRWGQLTFAERDLENFDADEWIGLFERTRVDGVCLSAAGYVAYYPTDVPLHHRSAWLGDHDHLGDLIAGARERGISVLLRSDPHAVHQDAFDAHPEWVSVDADGKPRPHQSMPGAWLTCVLGSYGQGFMTEVHREIARRYDVLGIFCNRWAGSGICYCERCRADFRTFSGYEIPVEPDQADPAQRALHVWREERLLALIDRWSAAVDEERPGTVFIPNGGGGALSELDTTRLAGHVPGLFADRQARHGLMALWASGKSAKEYRAVMREKPVGGIFGVGLEERYRWKDSVQSPSEFRLWVAGLIAHGSRPWYTKFGGHIRDPRWIDTVAEIYEGAERAERYLRNERPLAEVGLVFSQQNARYYGGADPQGRVEDHVLGMYQALVEARIPFEMVHDGLLDEEHLRGMRTLVLANAAALSDGQCDQIRAFVRRGGAVVATHETSRYDERGVRRDDFGLADLFGATGTGEVIGPVCNSYLELGDGPVATGFDGAHWIINGVYRLPVIDTTAPGERVDSGVRLVPGYPNLPMEELYPREPTGDQQVLLREYGEGRVAYLPWDIDRTFWEILNPDHGRLIANVLDWATPGPRVLDVQGPGLLDVSVWQQAGSVAVHLVNLTNPMALKGLVRELYPVGPLRITLRLPKAATARAVSLARRRESLPFRQQGGQVTVELDRLVDHEIIAIDL